MFKQLRENLVLVLIGLLPFHAFLVTVFTKVLKGPGNPPWSLLAVWKEALLLVILGISLWEIFQFLKQKKEKRVAALKLDQIDWCILTIFLLSVLVILFAFQGLKETLLGVKYDLVPLGIFFVLRRVEWSENFLSRALRVVFTVGIAVAALGILSFVLPMKVFTALGYSDLHSLYVPGGPVAAFQQIGSSGVRRIQSVMSGPNQLGLWLLLPLSISLLGLLRSIHNGDSLFLRLLHMNKPKRVVLFVYGASVLVIGSAIFLTFSRSAWICTLLIVVLSILLRFSTDRAQRYLVRLIAPFLFGFALLAIIAPHVLFREGSTSDHFIKPLIGIHKMASSPFGMGLGTAGPASNRTSDACVFLDAGADTTWAADRPDLCVIVDGMQMQPDNHVCECPFVTENWYVQIGVELGFAGFFAFLCVVFLLLQQLWKETDEAHVAVMYAFLGVSVAGLFLHSWEDTAVAYTLWVLLAVEMHIQLKESILPERKEGE